MSSSEYQEQEHEEESASPEEDEVPEAEQQDGDLADTEEANSAEDDEDLADSRTEGFVPVQLTSEELAESERYFDELQSDRKETPDRKPADAYERKHTGDYNYTLRGGGEKIDADGYRVKDAGALVVLW